MQHALFQLLYAKQRVIFENNCSSFSFPPPPIKESPYRIIIHSHFLLSIYHLIAIKYNNSFLILSSLSSVIVRINYLQNEFETNY